MIIGENMQEKTCRICKELKNISHFHKKKDTKDGHRNECKECVKEIQKKYKEKPDFKEKRKKYDKKRYEQNKELRLKQKKEWYYKNHEYVLKQKKDYNSRPEVIERRKEWWKEYSKNNKDIIYRYRNKYPHVIIWRSILYSTLKRLNKDKSDHTIKELGYSADELKKHIESLFTDGMNWDNYGEWHIDHIKPVSSFDKNTDVSIVCALNNLQPLWATTREIDGIIYEGNLNKSNKINL